MPSDAESAQFSPQDIDFIPAEQAGVIAEIYAGTASLEESIACRVELVYANSISTRMIPGLLWLLVAPIKLSSPASACDITRNIVGMHTKCG